MLRHSSCYAKTRTVCISLKEVKKRTSLSLIEVTYLFNYSSKEYVAYGTFPLKQNVSTVISNESRIHTARDN